MKINKAKSQVLKLELGLNVILEQRTRVLVKQKLNVSQQRTLAAKNHDNIGLY